MAGTGQFQRRSDGKITTTYEPTSEGCSQLINDFYDGGYGAFYGSFARSAGAPVFDGGLNNTGYSGGFFNPKFGMDVTAAMFTSKAVSSCLSKRAYDWEGMRLVTEYASYGLAEEFLMGPSNTRVFDSTAYPDGTFMGLGAATVPDGQIPNSVKTDYDMIRVPYKELPLPYDYGLGLKALEGKDDTASYKQYIDLIGKNYADLTDKTILRPIAFSGRADKRTQPLVGTQETSLNGLARIFASGTEVASGDNLNNYLPWGGLEGDMAGGYQGQMNSGQGRKLGFADADIDSNGVWTGTNTHVRNNYDAQIEDAEGSVPSLGMFDNLYMNCLTNWEGDYTDKLWVMSPLMWNKLNQLCKANNIYVDSMYTTMSIGGMKTNEGRDVGMALSSYMNLPIMMSGNLTYNYTGKTVDTAVYGDAFLLDLKHVWMCMTSPVEVWTIENPAITRDLKEHTITHMRAELRADKFISSGRLKNVGASA